MGGANEDRSTAREGRGAFGQPAGEKAEEPLANAPTLQRGAVLDRYLIIGSLGAGGMGVVYAAYDPELDRRVAIKVLRPEAANNDDAWQARVRLVREARALARLSHPNVVAVHHVHALDDDVFVVMELVEGQTLGSWLSVTPRTWREVLAAYLQAGRGLAAAHAAGLVHRDFKPENVLVDADGRARVLDFGLARAAGARDSSSSWRCATPTPVPASATIATRVTEPGAVMGTLAYMAPELMTGKAADAASDQFSFAVALYEALYGQRPYMGKTIGDLLTAIKSGVAREVPKGTRVPARLRALLLRALAADPAVRFPSMPALLSALEHDPLASRRRYLAWAGVVATAAFVVGVTAFMVTSHRERACVADRHELDGVWDDATREDVRAALIRTDVDHGTDTAARVLGVLDETAAKWLAMRTDVCEASLLRRQPEEVRRLRSDCLDRRRTELRALTSTFRRGDPNLAKKALDAAYALTETSTCADIQALRGSPGLPDDPKARSLVLEARSHLARAESLALMEQQAEALDAAQAALTIARQAGHDSTTAEALYRIGDIKRSIGDFASAEPQLAEATWAAISSGTDAIAAQAAALSAFVIGPKLQRPVEAHMWLGTADAALHHLGGSDEVEAIVDGYKAVVLTEGDWRPDLAMEPTERLVALHRRLHGVHPLTERAIYQLGVNHAYLGHFSTACTLYEQALEMAKAIGGPREVDVAKTSFALGDCLTAQGEYARGQEFLQRALAVFEREHIAYWSAMSLQVATRSALVRGEGSAAVSLARRALAYLAKVPTTSVLVPIVQVTAADALMRGGMKDEALDLCNTALAAEERAHQFEDGKVLGWDALRCRGEALLLLGRAREAVPPLERSLELTRRIYPGDLARTRFALARALVRSGGDIARARALAIEARNDFVATGFLPYEAGNVDGWLSGAISSATRSNLHP